MSKDNQSIKKEVILFGKDGIAKDIFALIKEHFSKPQSPLALKPASLSAGLIQAISPNENLFLSGKDAPSDSKLEAGELAHFIECIHVNGLNDHTYANTGERSSILDFVKTKLSEDDSIEKQLYQYILDEFFYQAKDKNNIVVKEPEIEGEEEVIITDFAQLRKNLAIRNNEEYKNHLKETRFKEELDNIREYLKKWFEESPELKLEDLKIRKLVRDQTEENNSDYFEEHNPIVNYFRSGRLHFNEFGLGELEEGDKDKSLARFVEEKINNRNTINIGGEQVKTKEDFFRVIGQRFAEILANDAMEKFYAKNLNKLAQGDVETIKLLREMSEVVNNGEALKEKVKNEFAVLLDPYLKKNNAAKTIQDKFRKFSLNKTQAQLLNTGKDETMGYIAEAMLFDRDKEATLLDRDEEATLLDRDELGKRGGSRFYDSNYGKAYNLIISSATEQIEGLETNLDGDKDEFLRNLKEVKELLTDNYDFFFFGAKRLFRLACEDVSRDKKNYPEDHYGADAELVLVRRSVVQTIKEIADAKRFFSNFKEGGDKKPVSSNSKQYADLKRFINCYLLYYANDGEESRDSDIKLFIERVKKEMPGFGHIAEFAHKVNPEVFKPEEPYNFVQLVEDVNVTRGRLQLTKHSHDYELFTNKIKSLDDLIVTCVEAKTAETAEEQSKKIQQLEKQIADLSSQPLNSMSSNQSWEPIIQNLLQAFSRSAGNSNNVNDPQKIDDVLEALRRAKEELETQIQEIRKENTEDSIRQRNRLEELGKKLEDKANEGSRGLKRDFKDIDQKLESLMAGASAESQKLKTSFDSVDKKLKGVQDNFDTLADDVRNLGKNLTDFQGNMVNKLNHLGSQFDHQNNQKVKKVPTEISYANLQQVEERSKIMVPGITGGKGYNKKSFEVLLNGLVHIPVYEDGENHKFESDLFVALKEWENPEEYGDGSYAFKSLTGHKKKPLLTISKHIRNRERIDGTSSEEVYYTITKVDEYGVDTSYIEEAVFKERVLKVLELNYAARDKIISEILQNDELPSVRSILDRQKVGKSENDPEVIYNQKIIKNLELDNLAEAERVVDESFSTEYGEIIDLVYAADPEKISSLKSLLAGKHFKELRKELSDENGDLKDVGKISDQLQVNLIETQWETLNGKRHGITYEYCKLIKNISNPDSRRVAQFYLDNSRFEDLIEFSQQILQDHRSSNGVKFFECDDNEFDRLIQDSQQRFQITHSKIKKAKDYLDHGGPQVLKLLEEKEKDLSLGLDKVSKNAQLNFKRQQYNLIVDQMGTDREDLIRIAESNGNQQQALDTILQDNGYGDKTIKAEAKWMFENPNKIFLAGVTWEEIKKEFDEDQPTKSDLRRRINKFEDITPLLQNPNLGKLDPKFFKTLKTNQVTDKSLYAEKHFDDLKDPNKESAYVSNFMGGYAVDYDNLKNVRRVITNLKEAEKGNTQLDNTEVLSVVKANGLFDQLKERIAAKTAVECNDGFLQQKAEISNVVNNNIANLTEEEKKRILKNEVTPDKKLTTAWNYYDNLKQTLDLKIKAAPFGGASVNHKSKYECAISFSGYFGSVDDQDNKSVITNNCYYAHIPGSHELFVKIVVLTTKTAGVVPGPNGNYTYKGKPCNLGDIVVDPDIYNYRARTNNKGERILNNGKPVMEHVKLEESFFERAGRAAVSALTLGVLGKPDSFNLIEKEVGRKEYKKAKETRKQMRFLVSSVECDKNGKETGKRSFVTMVDGEVRDHTNLMNTDQEKGILFARKIDLQKKHVLDHKGEELKFSFNRDGTLNSKYGEFDDAIRYKNEQGEIENFVGRSRYIKDNRLTLLGGAVHDIQLFAKASVIEGEIPNVGGIDTRISSRIGDIIVSDEIFYQADPKSPKRSVFDKNGEVSKDFLEFVMNHIDKKDPTKSENQSPPDGLKIKADLEAMRKELQKDFEVAVTVTSDPVKLATTVYFEQTDTTKSFVEYDSKNPKSYGGRSDLANATTQKSCVASSSLKFDLVQIRAAKLIHEKARTEGKEIGKYLEDNKGEVTDNLNASLTKVMEAVVNSDIDSEAIRKYLKPAWFSSVTQNFSRETLDLLSIIPIINELVKNDRSVNVSNPNSTPPRNPGLSPTEPLTAQEMGKVNNNNKAGVGSGTNPPLRR